MKVFANSWFLGALLVLMTALVWNHRFELTDHPMNGKAFDQEFFDQLSPPLTGHCSFRTSAAGSVLRIERKEGTAGVPSAKISLSDLADVRFLYFECDYRLHDVIPGNVRWLQSRGTVTDTMDDGREVRPQDCELFEGHGSTDWTALKLVRELTAQVEETHFNFAMLGQAGVLELRNFRFFKVSERPWISLAANILLASWFIYFFRLLEKAGVKSLFRNAAASSFLLLTAWVGVFPQTHTLLVPLFGEFALNLPEASPKITSTAAGAHEVSNLPPPAPAPASGPALKTHFESQERSQGGFHRVYREVAGSFSSAHFLIFFAATVAWFILTGQRRSWPLIATLAVSAELISPFTFYGSDLKDLGDLAFNLSGVFLGYWTWRLVDHPIKALGSRIGKARL